MPFDPISAAIAGGGMLFDFINKQGARKDAQAQAAQAMAMQQANIGQQQDNQRFQLQNLYDALNQSRQGKSDALRTAGGLRLDQFGNATYYDPQQGRWITSYSPSQQALISGGEARQGRAQARGSQASQDYDQLRGEYLYQKPKSEAESYAEIVDLLNQAQGTGERQLNTLMNRWGVRTAGNLPQLTQMDRGPTPGQELGERMLKARGAALDESLKRQSGHTSQYLPALKQFEDTANYVAPVDPTGSGILGMQGQGQKDLLGSMSDYDKLLASVYAQGGQGINTAAGLLNTAYGGANNAASLGVRASAAGGPDSGDFLKLAQMMMPGKEAAVKGTVGDTKGATYSGGGGDSGDRLGNFDHRYNYLMTNDPQKGAGTEAAPFGGAARVGSADYSPFAVGTYGVPDYGLVKLGFGSGNARDDSEGAYKTPWTF